MVVNILKARADLAKEREARARAEGELFAWRKSVDARLDSRSREHTDITLKIDALNSKVDQLIGELHGVGVIGTRKASRQRAADG